MKKIGIILVIVLAFISCGDGADSGGGISSGPGGYLYAKAPAALSLDDTPIDLTGTMGDTIVDKVVNYVNDNSGTYTLVLDSNIAVAGNARTINNSSAKLTIIGIGAERTISLSSTGRMFTVNTGSLTIGDSITLQGCNDNGDSLVFVNSNFTMETGSKITGNKIDLVANPDFGGGGVYVGGTFTMNGGEISGNKAYQGGGVYVIGSFTMADGTIYGNDAGANSNTVSNNGAAVYISIPPIRSAKYGDGTDIYTDATGGTESEYWVDDTIEGKPAL